MCSLGMIMTIYDVRCGVNTRRFLIKDVFPVIMGTVRKEAHDDLMKGERVTGLLVREDGKLFIQGAEGRRLCTDEKIWEGYAAHWIGKKVCARRLPQVDYETGKPLLLVWPHEAATRRPSVALYFNERLRKYPASFLGHVAIRVTGAVFNFSHLMNENEVMTPEEYFYRPCLGEFAPHPELGKYHIEEDGRPYYDKFGRLFMRTVHVLEIEGLPNDLLTDFYREEIQKIVHTPELPEKPGYYSQFNLLTRNCTTVIRDGLRMAGLPGVKGAFPRDLFVNVSYHLLKKNTRNDVTGRIFRLNQLKVPEAPRSALPPPVNPFNVLRLLSLRSAQLASEEPFMVS